MSGLDQFFSDLSTTDTKKKLSHGDNIIQYLEKHGSIDCEDTGAFIDSLVPWMQSSNFKVLSWIDYDTVRARKLWNKKAGFEVMLWHEVYQSCGVNRPILICLLYNIKDS